MTPDYLKESRSKLGLTQRQIAAAINTPYRTYQDWERGKRRVPGIAAFAVACLLKKKGRAD